MTERAAAIHAALIVLAGDTRLYAAAGDEHRLLSCLRAQAHLRREFGAAGPNHQRRRSGAAGAGCGASEARWGRVTLDHKWPLSRYGAHSEDNLQIAHFFCNVAKGNALTFSDDWRDEVRDALRRKDWTFVGDAQRGRGGKNLYRLESIDHSPPVCEPPRNSGILMKRTLHGKAT